MSAECERPSGSGRQADGLPGVAYQFSDSALLEQALRHRSAGAPHNERLEFLGDALVNLMVAQALYDRWPKADEGALTRARASLVRESALAGIARNLGLGDRLQFGPGELKSGGWRRDSILADALEALVAGIHLDAGFETCREVVLPWFMPLIEMLVPGKIEKDPKTRLQEWLQARQLPRPQYTLVEGRGDDHARVFVVSCRTEEPEREAKAEAASLRAAEQLAASQVLASLEVEK